MLRALSEISKIKNFLEESITSKSIRDYRISFGFNMDVDVFVYVNEKTQLFKDSLCSSFPKTNIKLISSDDLHRNPYYQGIFDNEDKVINLRRRLDRQFDPKETASPINTPVITFYSYKGGVGRTTTLAAFAAYYATHEKKTVVLIDCDFEAPGITNFFGLQSSDVSGAGESKNGVVEYLSDREFLGDDEDQLNLDDYVIPVSVNYAGEGNIYIVPAGNLSAKPVPAGDLSAKPVPEALKDTHLNHYLEGLSRLNFSGTEQIIEQFTNLLKHIEKKYVPDVILIDSRTGFNDIFVNIGLSVSNVIVGFFSSNFQTIPGLNFVLSDSEIRKKLILVNSIVLGRADHADFENLITSEIIPNLPSEIGEGIPSYPIYRNRLWELLGTYSEEQSDFIRFIKNKDSDYSKLFGRIIDRLDNKSDEVHEENQSGVVKVDPPTVSSLRTVVTSRVVKVDPPTIGGSMSSEPENNYYVSLRESILGKLKENLPVLYAEQDTFTENFFRDQFYLRNCMFDLFSKDRFLICGAKGTGKTFLYRMLSTQEPFLKLLKDRDSDRKGIPQDAVNYIVINVISLKSNFWEKPEQLKYLELDSFLTDDYKNDADFFFKRIWLVYTWNAIFLEQDKFVGFFPLQTALANNESLKPQALSVNDAANARIRFLKLIEDSNIQIIEADLRALDIQLKQHNLRILLTYDQLDSVVKPNLWSERIAPLINYWAANTFSNIFPKLFVRRDLFDKLGNINNIQSLRNEIRMLNLDWKKEEIFGVFFKLIFAHAQKELFELMRLYAKSTERNRISLTEQQIQKIELAIDKKYNQIKQDELYLKPLVETFFGKQVETGGYPVDTYDWFYKNLCNADGTISLRPFLDLMKYAIENYFNSSVGTLKYQIPILGQRDFTYGEVRKHAVDNHFNDLASEAGNEKLKLFISYLQLHAPSRLKKSFLTSSELKELIENVKETYPEEFVKDSTMSIRLFDEFRSLLISNGVIRQVPSSGGYINYSFAFLYKYYLGLSSKRTGYY